MPFDLTNASTIFQCLMNVIFAKYMRKFMLVFMNDILIFSKTMDNHVEHLKIIFQTLMENQLFIKFNKCTFA
jgi:hypothetical protein